MRQGGVEPSDDRFIFCSIVKTKRGKRLRETGNMSYTRLHGCFIEKPIPGIYCSVLWLT